MSNHQTAGLGATLLTAALLGGCFTPEYGDVAYACNNDDLCPDGYSCEGPAGNKVCRKIGAAQDQGSPDLDRGNPDLADAGKLPDNKLPTKDSGEDLPSKAPTVAATGPAAGAQSFATHQKFEFTVTLNGWTITQCELLVAGKSVQTNIQAVAGANSYTHKQIIDSATKVPWQIRCQVKGRAPIQTTSRDLTVGYKPIKGCNPKHKFTANTRYKLMGPANAKGDDCLVIDKDQVLLDGGKREVLAGKTKDLVLGRGKTSAFLKATYHPALSQKWTSSNLVCCETTVARVNAADLDGDGDLDLALPFSGSPGVWTLYENLKGAAFKKTAQELNSGYQPSRIVDVNHDGRLDVLLGNISGPEMLLTAHATKAFDYTYTSLGNNGVLTKWLELADFDNDGYMDLVVGNQFNNTDDALRVLRNAKGVFSLSWTQKKLSGGFKPGIGLPVHVADFDGDRRWDMLVGLRTSSDTTSAVVQNTYSVKSGIDFKIIAQFKNWYPLAALDMDHDGRTDLVLYGYQDATNKTNVLRIYYQQPGSKPWTKYTEIAIPQQDPGKAAAIGDVNGDGFQDIVVAPTQSTNKPAMIVNPKNQTSAWSAACAGCFEAGQVFDLALRDLDGDGMQDLVHSVTNNNATVNAYRAGSGGFPQYTKEVVWTHTSGSGLQVEVVGDLDGKPTRGLTITGKDVTVRNVAALRGFSYGVDVKSGSATLANVGVRDPDLFGVRFWAGTTGTLSNVTVAQLHQGVALGLHGPGTSVQVSSSALCPEWYQRNLTALSTYCTGGATVTLSGGTKIKLNNGCKIPISTSWNSCK